MSNDNMRIAAQQAAIGNIPKKDYNYPICRPTIAPGVLPSNTTSPILALDDNFYNYASMAYSGVNLCGGFPGFPYLSQLSTRAEYRAFAAALSTEITREWIEFDSKQDDDSSNGKLKLIEEEFKRLNVRDVIKKAAELDCFFGRAHIFLKINGQDIKVPLVLDPRTVPLGSFTSISTVEPIWTSPATYNALDPTTPDFYKPTKWFMLGQETHSSRLMTIITREMPDMLKPAFDFAGISLSQLAEPYVDNWLRTRQSVSDLINNFSITALATSMDQIFQVGAPEQASIFDRAKLFTALRSNQGLMLLDKDREELVQLNTPLGGLHELQAQSQEHMCSVSRMPAIVLTGISPSGLNASSDGEIRIFYDWISSQQEAYYRKPIETILKLVQLSLFGVIDHDINFAFVPLYQMTGKELSEIRKSDCDAGVAYINAGVIDPLEERERLANDPESGYQGLDLAKIIEPPAQPDPFGGFGGGETDGTLKPDGAPSEVDENIKNPAGAENVVKEVDKNVKNT